jgi:hypothetical protein
MTANPPPTLLQMEAPLLVEGPADVAAAAAAGARRVALKGSDSQIEDILNSMLPPRCASGTSIHQAVGANRRAALAERKGCCHANAGLHRG